MSTTISEDSSRKALNVAYKGYKDGSVEFFGDNVQAMTGYSREVFNSRQMKKKKIITVLLVIAACITVIVFTGSLLVKKGRTQAIDSVVESINSHPYKI